MARAVGEVVADPEEYAMLAGLALLHGLQLASKLPTPIFTPATKAEVSSTYSE